jgi:hypothetical protein
VTSRRRSFLCLFLVCGGVLLPAGKLRAQLAITEVMPHAWTNAAGYRFPDFWELTNFGTNEVDLRAYRFTDLNAIDNATSEAFRDLAIQPRESIIFSREDPNFYTNESQFRDWWGADRLVGVRIIVVPRTDPADETVVWFPGLNPGTDILQLWDGDNNYVDSVAWMNASDGYTFTYSPVTGEFPVTSREEICHAVIAAATGHDVGSPGRHCDPIPLWFDLEPTNAVADAGTSVTLSSRAHGFPRPRFQWYFNGEKIPNGTNSWLSFVNITPGEAGPYYVVITNGLNVVTSRVAELAVNTNDRPCELISGLSDLTVTFREAEAVGEQPTFRIVTRGYPLCTFQWYFNGLPLTGQTDSSLQIGPVTSADAGDYMVVASNDLATCTASAKLTVTRPPELYITEIMAWPAQGYADWWELTNYDTEAVELLGYRFVDVVGTFDRAVTITNSLIIAPGESIIFCDGITTEEFRQWWGAEHLPPRLQVFTYEKFGFADTTDALRLWNATTTLERVFIHGVGYDGPVRNVTLRFQPTFWTDQEESVTGENGAFCAANGGSIGSPGYVTNPPPRITAIRRLGSDTILRWRAPAGMSCTLEAKDALAQGAWVSLGSFVADCTIMTVTNSAAGRQRFYRLVGAEAMRRL